MLPKTRVLFYREEDESVPLLNWLDDLPSKVVAKCRVRIERLADLGHELRRPEADFLRDGIYELRVRQGRRHYRMLYFFHGNVAAILSHGLVKEREVPAAEIKRAIDRKRKFEEQPEKHTYEES